MSVITPIQPIYTSDTAQVAQAVLDILRRDGWYNRHPGRGPHGERCVGYAIGAVLSRGANFFTHPFVMAFCRQVGIPGAEFIPVWNDHLAGTFEKVERALMALGAE